MRTNTTFHTIRETAWILGVSRSAVSRAIRTGALRATRRSGLKVSSTEIKRVLNTPAGVA
ncbi:hypothetical protein YIM_21640 [Amycolatopsis sp. YIM 10]|nr:hypothetical protein YIM_21640 [Amycolatopsis sp. YIM 10]